MNLKQKIEKLAGDVLDRADRRGYGLGAYNFMTALELAESYESNNK